MNCRRESVLSAHNIPEEAKSNAHTEDDPEAIVAREADAMESSQRSDDGPVYLDLRPFMDIAPISVRSVPCSPPLFPTYPEQAAHTQRLAFRAEILRLFLPALQDGNSSRKGTCDFPQLGSPAFASCGRRWRRARNHH